MTQPICTPKQKAKYIQWLRDGIITRMDLAERLHCSPATIGDWMHEAGIPIRAKAEWNIHPKQQELLDKPLPDEPIYPGRG